MGCFEYECDACQHQWEDICSYKDPIPSVCPECQEEGKVRRLISLPAQGKVELYGYDLKSKLKNNAADMIRQSNKSENVLANLVGENKYQNNLTLQKQIKETRPKIKSSRKS